jgi:hypothetical protein
MVSSRLLATLATADNVSPPAAKTLLTHVPEAAMCTLEHSDRKWTLLGYALSRGCTLHLHTRILSWM